MRRDRDDEEDDRPRRKSRRRDDDPPRRRRSGVPVWVYVAGGAAVLLVCLVVLLLVMLPKKTTNGPNSAVPAVPAATTFEPISIDTLMDEWQANALGASSRYGKKGVDITGTVRTFDPSITPLFFLVHGDKSTAFRGVQVFPASPKSREAMMRCSVGQRVRVKATIDFHVAGHAVLHAEEVELIGAAPLPK